MRRYPFCLAVVVTACLTCSSPLRAVTPAPAAAVEQQSSLGLPQVDRRLNVTTTAWEQDIRVGELLSRLGQQHSIPLQAAEGVGAIRVTVFSRNRPLRDLLIALSEVCRARWERQERRSTANGYLLTALGPQVPREDMEALFRARRQHAARNENAPFRDARATRLKLYRECASLAPDRLLERYEASDPWLCVDLLDPKLAPMTKAVAALPDQDLNRLLDEGMLTLPLRTFPVSCRRCLGLRASGHDEAPQGLGVSTNVDLMPRFSSPEDRWENSIVHLWWYSSGLQLQLEVPDVYRFDVNVIHTTDNPPLRARQRLVSLGLRQDTPSYRQQSDTQQREWEAANSGQAGRDDGQGLRYADLVPPPDQKDLRNAAPVAVESGGKGPLLAPDLLELIATQCRVGVVANYLPRLYFAMSPKRIASDGLSTLGSLMSLIRMVQQGGWSWTFQNEFLVARDANYELVEASAVPDAITSALRAKCVSGGSVSLGEVVFLVKDLVPMQMAQLQMEFRQLEYVLGNDLELYAGISFEQRPYLTSPAGLEIARLTPRQRAEVLAQAQRLRPWLTEADLSNTILRTLPRRFASGDEGISFIVEYHFPDSPRDRDTVFTLPLQIRLIPET